MLGKGARKRAVVKRGTSLEFLCSQKRHKTDIALIPDPLNFICLFPREVQQSGKILVIQVECNKAADLDLHKWIWLLVPDINGD